MFFRNNSVLPRVEQLCNVRSRKSLVFGGRGAIEESARLYSLAHSATPMCSPLIASTSSLSATATATHQELHLLPGSRRRSEARDTVLQGLHRCFGGMGKSQPSYLCGCTYTNTYDARATPEVALLGRCFSDGRCSSSLTNGIGTVRAKVSFFSQ